MKKKYRIIAIILVAIMILIEGLALVTANALEPLELSSKWWEMSSNIPYSDTFHYDGSLDNYQFQRDGQGMRYFAGMTGIHTYYVSPEFEDGKFQSQQEMLDAMDEVIDVVTKDASQYEKYVIFIPTQDFRKHSYDEPGYVKLDSDERYISFTYTSQVYTSGLDFREQAIVADMCNERYKYNLMEFVQYMKVGPEKFADYDYTTSEADPAILGTNAIYYGMNINHWNTLTNFASYRPEETVNLLFSTVDLAEQLGLSEEEFLKEQAKAVEERNSPGLDVILVDIFMYLISYGLLFGAAILIIVKVVKGVKKKGVSIKREEIEIEHRKADLRKKNAEIDRMEADNVARILNAPIKRMDSADEDFEAEYDNKKITRKVVEANRADKDKILNWYRDINYNGFNTDKYTKEAMELLFDIAIEDKLISESKYLSQFDDFAEWLALQEEE